MRHCLTGDMEYRPRSGRTGRTHARANGCAFEVLTTPVNEIVARIHDRPDDLMIMWPISTRVNFAEKR
jgi:hypothetical protein